MSSSYMPLYRSLRQSEGLSQNLIFSPHDLSRALAALALATAGPAHEEIVAFLDEDPLELLARELNGDEASTVLEALSFWYKEAAQLPLASPLPFPEDFHIDKMISVEQINAWVSDQTRDLIQNLISQEQFNQAGMIILSALYFKDLWADQFGSAEEGSFTLADGETISHPMLRDRRSCNYQEEDNWQVVSLSYQGSYELLLLLPEKGRHDELREQWLDIFAGISSNSMASEDVKLSFPKVDLQARAELDDALQAAGIESVFSPAADFNPLLSWPVDRVRVVHGCALKIDEQGAEAAAATAILMEPGGLPPEPAEPKQFIVDRPYFLALRHREEGHLLFAAEVMDPRK